MMSGGMRTFFKDLRVILLTSTQQRVDMVYCRHMRGVLFMVIKMSNVNDRGCKMPSSLQNCHELLALSCLSSSLTNVCKTTKMSHFNFLPFTHHHPHCRLHRSYTRINQFIISLPVLHVFIINNNNM